MGHSVLVRLHAAPRREPGPPSWSSRARARLGGARLDRELGVGTPTWRTPDPVSARGMALLGQLLSDGTSPCYMRHAPRALEHALSNAARWLEVED